MTKEELKEQDVRLNKLCFDYQEKEKRITELEKKNAEAKAIINIGIEGLKHWGIVAGYERPFAKEAEKLFNLFLDKAEQFLKGE